MTSWQRPAQGKSRRRHCWACPCAKAADGDFLQVISLCPPWLCPTLPFTKLESLAAFHRRRVCSQSQLGMAQICRELREPGLEEKRVCLWV